MKYLILALLLIATPALADYTYEKIDNEVKVTSTDTEITTTEETNSIEALKAKIAVLNESKANTLTYYNENITRLDAEIAVIETHIVEAKKLGCTEFVAIE